MWTWIVGAGAKVIGAFASLLDVALKWIGYLAVWKAATYHAEARRTKDIAEVKDEQLEVASRPVVHRSSILERMRQLRRESD